METQMGIQEVPPIKLSSEEIISKLKELKITPEFLEDGVLTNETYHHLKTLNINVDDENFLRVFLGNYKKVYQYGGEGKGDHYEIIIYFEDHDVYLQMTGNYDSTYGLEWWGGFNSVRPYEKTITYYK